MDDHNKTSITALGCINVLARSTDVPNSLEIFNELMEFYPTIKQYIAYSQRGFPRVCPRRNYSFTYGRYLSLNDALENVKNHSILEIGAGFSPRGLNFSENRVYLETDLPEIIEEKRKIIELIRERKGIHNVNHMFNELNILDFDKLRLCGKIIKDKSENPISLVSEGVLMYLEDYEQEKARDDITKFLAEFSQNGYWITPDFSYRNTLSNSNMCLDLREVRTDRKFNDFSTNEAISDFLRQGGLKVEFLSNEKISFSFKDNEMFSLIGPICEPSYYQCAKISLI